MAENQKTTAPQPPIRGERMMSNTDARQHMATAVQDRLAILDSMNGDQQRTLDTLVAESHRRGVAEGRSESFRILSALVVLGVVASWFGGLPGLIVMPLGVVGLAALRLESIATRLLDEAAR